MVNKESNEHTDANEDDEKPSDVSEEVSGNQNKKSDQTSSCCPTCQKCSKCCKSCTILWFLYEMNIYYKPVKSMTL